METYNRNTCLVLDEKQFQEVTKKSALLDTSETLELGSMKVGGNEYKAVYQRESVFSARISVIGTVLQVEPVGSIGCPVTRELLNAFLKETFDDLCKKRETLAELVTSGIQKGVVKIAMAEELPYDSGCDGIVASIGDHAFYFAMPYGEEYSSAEDYTKRTDFMENVYSITDSILSLSDEERGYYCHYLEAQLLQPYRFIENQVYYAGKADKYFKVLEKRGSEVTIDTENGTVLCSLSQESADGAVVEYLSDGNGKMKIGAAVFSLHDKRWHSVMELPQNVDYYTQLDDMKKSFRRTASYDSQEEFCIGSASLGNIMMDVVGVYTGQNEDGYCSGFQTNLEDYAIIANVYYGLLPEEATEKVYCPDEEFPYEEYSDGSCATMVVPAELFLSWDENQYRRWVTDSFKELIIDSPDLLLLYAERTDRFWQRRDAASHKESVMQASDEQQAALDKVRQAATAAAIQRSVPVKAIQQAFFDGLSKAGREREAILPVIQSMTAGKTPRKMMERTLSLMGASQETFGPMLDTIRRKEKSQR